MSPQDLFTVKSLTIKCSECGGTDITVYQEGHLYAGLYKCNTCGNCQKCPHHSTHVETVPDDFHDPRSIYGHGQDVAQVKVCDECDMVIEGETE